MTTTENTPELQPTNGNGLPPIREAVVEQGNRIHQEVCHERDELRLALGTANATIAGYKVAVEAQQAQLAEMDSRLTTAYVVRDGMVAKAEHYKAVLISIGAQLRAFEIESAPLIREREEEPTIGGA